MIKRCLNLYKKNKQVINYLIVGALATFISIGSFAIYQTIINNYIINIILSWCTAVVFAYFTNRIFVFETKNTKILPEFIKFISCRLLTLDSEVLVMWILVDLIEINELISKVLVQFIVIVLNYILSKIFVFKK